MISRLKNSVCQELEEFGLLPMNKANYRHSWTYSFDADYLTDFSFAGFWASLKFEENPDDMANFPRTLNNSLEHALGDLKFQSEQAC